jgi:hypothetical protein
MVGLSFWGRVRIKRGAAKSELPFNTKSAKKKEGVEPSISFALFVFRFALC